MELSELSALGTVAVAPVRGGTALAAVASDPAFGAHFQLPSAPGGLDLLFAAAFGVEALLGLLLLFGRADRLLSE